MSDSEEEFSELISCYASSTVKTNFKKQFNLITSKSKNNSPPKVQSTENNGVIKNAKPIDTSLSFQNNSIPFTNSSRPSNILKNKLVETSSSFDEPESASQKSISISSSDKPSKASGSSSQENDLSQSSGEINYSGTVVNAEQNSCRYNTRSRTKSSNPVAVVAPTKKKTVVVKKPPVKRNNAKRLKNAECIEILDEPAKTPKAEEDFNYETSVKVLWKSMNVIRFSVRRLQKLSVIFEALMKQENVTLDEILLTFCSVPVKPTDTPDSLNLNVCDFLEGGIVSKKAESEPVQKKQLSYFLNFQYESKKLISLPTKLNDPMKKVMLLFAEQVEKPPSTVRFLVDGEEISGSDTPKSLDLEKGDIIDVVISN